MPRSPPRRAILVVDDDRDFIETMADVLRDAGRLVETAMSGVEALQKLDEVQRPCLVLLDLQMPEMGGFEFLERLKTHPYAADFSVVLMTADSKMPEAGMYPAVQRALRKPFELDELLGLVGRN
jgi:CheY-like chemotaxis protein